MQHSPKPRSRKRKSSSFGCGKRRKKQKIMDLLENSFQINECCFCGEGENLEYGAFFQDENRNLAAHQFCLFFSAGLPQSGKDNEGFDGFMFNDILSEINRAKDIRCRICKKGGASGGCSVRTCRSVYHYKCGLQHNVQYVFSGAFESFCKKHRSNQNLRRILRMQPPAKCPICIEDITVIDKQAILKTPCCVDVFLHRDCVKMQADVSGYFFRCPTCNNVDKFTAEMSNYGIFRPQRDAAWEGLDAFSELLEQYHQCDILNCQCHYGRMYSANRGIWRLYLCYMCGQSAAHRSCLTNNFIPRFGYVCNVCNDVAAFDRKKSFHIVNSFEHRNIAHRKRLVDLTAKGDPVLMSSSVFATNYWKKKHNICEFKVVIEPLSMPTKELPSPVDTFSTNKFEPETKHFTGTMPSTEKNLPLTQCISSGMFQCAYPGRDIKLLSSGDSTDCKNNHCILQTSLKQEQDNYEEKLIARDVQDHVQLCVEKIVSAEDKENISNINPFIKSENINETLKSKSILGVPINMLQHLTPSLNEISCHHMGRILYDMVQEESFS